MLQTVERILGLAREVDGRLRVSVPPALVPSFTDLCRQYDGLIHPGFVTAAGVERLDDLVRYLRAMQRRLDKLPHDRVRDQLRVRTIDGLWAEYQQLLSSLPPGRPAPTTVSEIRWLFEELRVSWFAQELGTRAPLSEQRILKAIDTALE